MTLGYLDRRVHVLEAKVKKLEANDVQKTLAIAKLIDALKDQVPVELVVEWKGEDE